MRRPPRPQRAVARRLPVPWQAGPAWDLGRKVLVVDHEPERGASLVGWLARAGHHPVLATGAARALDELRRGPHASEVRAILLQADRPELRALVGEILADARLRQVPVVWIGAEEEAPLGTLHLDAPVVLEHLRCALRVLLRLPV